MAIDTAIQLEQILNGNKDKARLFTDLDGTMQSVASSKQVERRYMRSDVNILKQHMEEKRIEFIAWVPDELQLGDALTKDKVDKVGINDLMQHR